MGRPANQGVDVTEDEIICVSLIISFLVYACFDSYLRYQLELARIEATFYVEREESR